VAVLLLFLGLIDFFQEGDCIIRLVMLGGGGGGGTVVLILAFFKFYLQDSVF